MRSRDYEEFIEFLNQIGARYLIVGAHAVAFHARPRAKITGSLLSRRGRTTAALEVIGGRGEANVRTPSAAMASRRFNIAADRIPSDGSCFKLLYARHHGKAAERNDHGAKGASVSFVDAGGRPAVRFLVLEVEAIEGR